MKHPSSRKDAGKPEAWDFEYPIEDLLAYKNTPTKWKLEWLEEINRLTFKVLTKKEREFREKMRRGEIG